MKEAGTVGGVEDTVFDVMLFRGDLVDFVELHIHHLHLHCCSIGEHVL
jgi:hypothetical protein